MIGAPGIAAARWDRCIQALDGAFTRSGRDIFAALMAGWVLCTGRRTVIGIYRYGDPQRMRAHDAFHRFIRCATWSCAELWKIVALTLVACLAPNGVLTCDLDDTLYHKTGRRVDGAGWWRDAVRSTGSRVVTALGLNVVVITLRIRPPWGGEPLGLPIWAALHRKGGTKLTTLAAQGLTTLAAWFPDRRILCCADGAYAAPLIPLGNDRLVIISRMRRDAALYDRRPPPTGKRGRPRQKGRRLGTPAQLAVRTKRWASVVTDRRGHPAIKLVHARTVLWYAVSRQPVLLVISRDPAGHERDDFWVCSDVTMPPAQVVGAYAGRWSIEDTFRATKQSLGVHQPQTWKGLGPERAIMLGLVLYSLIWWWFVGLDRRSQQVIPEPWYSSKATPSFADALAALRRQLWRNRISDDSASDAVSGKIIETMIDALARAA
jgi:DDE superfamily endonuclease